jgi:hypothetical protein
MVRQLGDELTQIKLEQSTNMTSQHSMIEQIAKELREIKSEISTTPPIDHNGFELNLSATYHLLLDFDGAKVLFNNMKHLFELISVWRQLSHCEKGRPGENSRSKFK